jgi:hypothetical protein
MPYLSPTQYKKLVEYYFEQEFSDLKIKDCILQTTRIERKTKEYWGRKIEKVMELYYQTKKQPIEAAAFIARLFKPRLKYLIMEK